MRRKAKVDDNQKEVVGQLRKLGISVAVTSQLGNGFCDLVLGWKGSNYLIELKDGNKTESRRKLTPDEQKFKDEWKGHYAVCKSLDEILETINL